MSTIDKKAALEVLNSLPVIDSMGGESAYVLVENNGENQRKLNAVGIPSVVFNRYADNEIIDIMALACQENIAYLYLGNKFISSDDCLELPTNKEGVSAVFYDHEGETYFVLSENGSVLRTKLSDVQIRGLKVLITGGKNGK